MVNVITAASYAVLYISGAAADLTTEATTGSTYSWQITEPTKRVLDPTYAVSESKGKTYTRAAAPGTGEFTVNRLTGTITYGDSQTGPVTVTGKYLPMSAMLAARDFTINIKPRLVDTSAMCVAALYQKKAQTIRDITGTIGGFFTPDGSATFDPEITEYFLAHVDADTTFALKFYMSSHFEMVSWVRVDTEAMKANIGNLADETVTFSSIPDAEGHIMSHT